MTQAVLAVAGLTRRVGGRAVVDDVTLDIGATEVVVLVGPSGCGKSTLLRLVSGLDRADAGTIVIDGVDITSTAPEHRGVGLVFQDHALFPHRRVGDNIAFGLRGLDRSARRRRVAELLDLVRLPGIERRYPHQLSGGEQQRVALARALAPRPIVILLDEPFASLDASLRDDLRSDVVAALRASATTAVLVTHDRDEALRTGDRVAVMRDGRLVQIDTPDAIYGRPADRFVAGFMAPASLLDIAGTTVLARPHQLTLTGGGTDLVIGLEYLGAVWRHRVRRGDGSIVVADVATGSRPLEVGATCTVGVDATEALHVLADR